MYEHRRIRRMKFVLGLPDTTLGSKYSHSVEDVCPLWNVHILTFDNSKATQKDPLRYQTKKDCKNCLRESKTLTSHRCITSLFLFIVQVKAILYFGLLEVFLQSQHHACVHPPLPPIDVIFIQIPRLDHAMGRMIKCFL